ncbi:ribonuclease HIII [bacterium]|nr:ribonuclease HIII [bacterium]
MPTVKFNESQIEEFCTIFKPFEEDVKNEYMSHFFRFKNASVTIYKSGKVVFQGSNLEMFYDYLEKDNKQLSLDFDEDTPYDYLNTIGADEVGTGDTFGPIVCAAVFVKAYDTEKLKNIGVKDSKKLNDAKIKTIGKYIKENYKYRVNIVRNEVFNDKYNILNMNEMKAKLHNQNIESLSKEVKYEAICLDEFVNRFKYFKYLNNEGFKDISFEMKGESKSIAVAAASILARYFFLLEFDRLEKEYGYKLPKGSGKNAQNMIDKIRNDGKENLFYHIAKTSFKNFNIK